MKDEANRLIGQWRITELENFDEDYADMEVPAYIRFGADGPGEFQFGLVRGFMDCRYERDATRWRARFSWEGNDEMERVFGRGWATCRGDGTMRGKIFIHAGDETRFRAVRADASSGTKSGRH